MTLVKVNKHAARPFEGLMNDLFNDFPSMLPKNLREDALNFPPVNITEKSDAFQIEMVVPGFEKTAINIKLDGNILSISSEKNEIKNEDADKIIRREFAHKSFKRSFTIDENIDAENINAQYENGVLKLQLPKKELTKAGTKEISIL